MASDSESDDVVIIEGDELDALINKSPSQKTPVRYMRMVDVLGRHQRRCGEWELYVKWDSVYGTFELWEPIRVFGDSVEALLEAFDEEKGRLREDGGRGLPIIDPSIPQWDSDDRRYDQTPTTNTVLGVEKIVAYREVSNRPEVLVKWLHLPMSDSTWEPISNLLDFLPFYQEIDTARRRWSVLANRRYMDLPSDNFVASANSAATAQFHGRPLASARAPPAERRTSAHNRTSPHADENRQAAKVQKLASTTTAPPPDSGQQEAEAFPNRKRFIDSVPEDSNKRARKEVTQSSTAPLPSEGPPRASQTSAAEDQLFGQTLPTISEEPVARSPAAPQTSSHKSHHRDNLPSSSKKADSPPLVVPARPAKTAADTSRINAAPTERVRTVDVDDRAEAMSLDTSTSSRKRPMSLYDRLRAMKSSSGNSAIVQSQPAPLEEMVTLNTSDPLAALEGRKPQWLESRDAMARITAPPPPPPVAIGQTVPAPPSTAPPPIPPPPPPPQPIVTPRPTNSTQQQQKTTTAPSNIDRPSDVSRPPSSSASQQQREQPRRPSANSQPRTEEISSKKVSEPAVGTGTRPPPRQSPLPVPVTPTPALPVTTPPARTQSQSGQSSQNGTVVVPRPAVQQQHPPTLQHVANHTAATTVSRRSSMASQGVALTTPSSSLPASQQRGENAPPSNNNASRQQDRRNSVASRSFHDDSLRRSPMFDSLRASARTVKALFKSRDPTLFNDVHCTCKAQGPTSILPCMVDAFRRAGWKDPLGPAVPVRCYLCDGDSHLACASKSMDWEYGEMCVKHKHLSCTDYFSPQYLHNWAINFLCLPCRTLLTDPLYQVEEIVTAGWLSPPQLTDDSRLKRCTLTDVPKCPGSELVLRATLSRIDCKDIKDGKKVLQIRSFKVRSDMSSFPRFPNDEVEISWKRVNSRIAGTQKLPKPAHFRVRKDTPYNFPPQAADDANCTFEIRIQTSFEHVLDGPYFVALVKAKLPTTSDHLFATIQRKGVAEYTRCMTHALALLPQQPSTGPQPGGDSDEEIELVNMRPVVKLTCPSTMLRMNIPARGVLCKHVQCFDLQFFLQSQNTSIHSARWKCPVCRIPCRPHEIMIDSWLLKVLQSAPGDVVEIQMKASPDKTLQWEVSKRTNVPELGGKGSEPVCVDL